MPQDDDNLVGAGGAEGDDLVHDEWAPVPVQQGFERAHAPRDPGGEEDGGGKGMQIASFDKLRTSGG